MKRFVLSLFVFAAGVALAAEEGSAIALPAEAPAAPVAKEKGTYDLPSPLTLEDALSYALEHNPQLKIVKEQLREQRGIMVQSVSGLLPTITASASATQVQNADQLSGNSTLNTGNRRTWGADVTLRQTLFAGGGVISNVRSNAASLAAAKARLTSQIETTVYDVKQNFYAVLVDREIIAVRKESLDVLEEQLKNVTARHAAGVASDFEKLQAQVAVANERPNLIRAQNAYRVAAEALLATLGVPSRTQLNPDDVKGELTTEAVSVELQALLDDAEAHRADILAARKDAEAACRSVGEARARYLPKVQALAGYDWTKDAATARMRDTVDGWNVGLVASVDLFNGFSNAAQVSQAKARRRQAEARELQTRLGVSVEVRQAYSAFEEAREILKSSKQVVEQARESLRMARARYSAGSSNQLDVLQAQSALSQARLTLLQSRYDYVVAVARLEKATGTHDWKLKIEQPK